MRAQIAFEYIMLMALGFLILMGGYYVVLSLVSQSQTNINTDQVRMISQDILDEARRLYELGTPSSNRLDIDMPDDVQHFYVHNYDHSYLVFVVGHGNDEAELDFISDVPLQMTMECADEMPARCDQGTCSCISEFTLTKGPKELLLLAVDDCTVSESCVNISYSLPRS